MSGTSESKVKVVLRVFEDEDEMSSEFNEVVSPRLLPGQLSYVKVLRMGM